MEHYFKDKKILLCLTGSIAVYKSILLLRELKRLGANLKVVMTDSATKFIGAALIEGILEEKPHTDLFANAMAHIHLAKWPDLILIAPATANTLAKYRMGLADDLLSNILLATIKPVVMVPAMNQAMWQHPATTENAKILKKRGVIFLGPASGQQACGDEGPGRMLEHFQILKHLPRFFCPQKLQGKTIVLTAGATREAIDPVRFISNYSSGKMAYALAQSAYYHGAKVILISGKTEGGVPAGVEYHEVESGAQMFDCVMRHIKKADVFIGVAAVCDFRPLHLASQKIKKGKNQKSLELLLGPTQDILAHVAALPGKPFCIGFAAETENVIAYAKEKLRVKKLDMIIANDVANLKGFGQEDNQAVIITKTEIIELASMHKAKLADQILQRL